MRGGRPGSGSHGSSARDEHDRPECRRTGGERGIRRESERGEQRSLHRARTRSRLGELPRSVSGNASDRNASTDAATKMRWMLVSAPRTSDAPRVGPRSGSASRRYSTANDS